MNWLSKAGQSTQIYFRIIIVYLNIWLCITIAISLKHNVACESLQIVTIRFQITLLCVYSIVLNNIAASHCFSVVQLISIFVQYFAPGLSLFLHFFLDPRIEYPVLSHT